jgi:hypothetical protein
LREIVLPSQTGELLLAEAPCELTLTLTDAVAEQLAEVMTVTEYTPAQSVIVAVREGVAVVAEKPPGPLHT